MNKDDFLDTLRRRLAGLPASEIDEVIADYTTHFSDGMAAGRSEADIAAALGDPLRLARELRAEAGFRRWESNRSPTNFLAVLFGFLALVAVDFIFLLPVLVVALIVAFCAGLAFAALCIGGIAVMFDGNGNFFSREMLSDVLVGIGLLGFGIGGGALLLWIMDGVVRLLTKYARLHYTLLDQANLAA